MESQNLKTIKDELSHLSQKQLIEIVLRLSRFKKENKELLSYELFEAQDEDNFVFMIKNEMDENFRNINTKTSYYIRKSCRKILTQTKKHIRYSKVKETEVRLLLHFCENMKEIKPSIKTSTRLQNMFNTQLTMAKKALSKLHEDLQYDYNIIIEQLEN
ncbi:MAG: hypothetical protein BM564_08085 [Bacteroidetes bacterium MedPE-SWsnd-G2]|nr:MAG: hypothetical protein BM564_08085 [Bacteroidetes bacterium MedPE-SWsnd-G2]